MAKKIVITSGKGGVGKTTITANIGRFLAQEGFNVVLVDIDFGLNNLDVIMGLDGNVIYDINDVFMGRCRLRQALIQDKVFPNLFILPSDSLIASSNITGQNIKLILENFNNTFDFILIDCPAGIDVGFHRAVSCSDQAIVVTTPQLTSLRDADKVVSILHSYKMNKIDLIVNRVRGDLILGKKMLSPFDVSKILRVDLLGVVPEEDAVFLSGGYNIPYKSSSYKAFYLISKNLINNQHKILNFTKKYQGFFGSIRRGIKGGL